MMTDHSEARVEAAAQAWMPREDQWPSVRPIMRKALAAADEVDRAAGVIRVEVNTDATLKLIRRACNDPGGFLPRGVQWDGEPNTLGQWQALAVAAALSAGAQPPPEEETQQ